MIPAVLRLALQEPGIPSRNLPWIRSSSMSTSAARREDFGKGKPAET